jgi:hypothetical protein
MRERRRAQRGAARSKAEKHGARHSEPAWPGAGWRRRRRARNHRAFACRDRPRDVRVAAGGRGKARTGRARFPPGRARGTWPGWGRWLFRLRSTLEQPGPALPCAGRNANAPVTDVALSPSPQKATSERRRCAASALREPERIECGEATLPSGRSGSLTVPLFGARYAAIRSSDAGSRRACDGMTGLTAAVRRREGGTEPTERRIPPAKRAGLP